MEQSPVLPQTSEVSPAVSPQPTQPIATEAEKSKTPLIIVVLVLVVILISISLGVVLAMRVRSTSQGTVPSVQEQLTPIVTIVTGTPTPTATPTYENPFQATPTPVINPFEQPANPFEGL